MVEYSHKNSRLSFTKPVRGYPPDDRYPAGDVLADGG